MRELAGELWTWTARHPDWNDDPHWGPEVRSYALRTRDGLILFDPIAPPETCRSSSCCRRTEIR